MWQQFWVQNLHYVLEVFVGFLMVTAGWIYLDGWLVERKLKTFARSLGFFVLAAWTFLDAVPVGIAWLERFISTAKLVDLTGLVGFGLLLLSLLVDPIPLRPGEKPIRLLSRLWQQSAWALLPLGLGGVTGGLLTFLLFPKFWIFFFAALITYLVYLHYKRGIQSEWKYFYRGFIVITLALLLASAEVLQGTTNVLLAKLLAPYHTVWALEHGLKVIGAVLLGAWAWGFIRFRIFPQIFSSFVALAFLIFLLTAIIYTGFLINRTQQSIIADLETNVKTLDFALAKIKESAILAARIAATNPQVREAVRRSDKEALFKNLNALMFENETNFMLAINQGGEVLIRAEDKERFGDSIALDPVVWRALDGKAVVTTSAEPGVTIPTVSIRAASPIVDTTETGEPQIIGAVVTGFLLDTAFVDGIKKITGLDITVFANDTAAATTFTVPESQIRLVGTRELNQQILTLVLKASKPYTGTASVASRPFLAAYIPIKDIEETTIGMFFTGRSQASILDLISDTIRLTFTISLLLMVLSILPLGWLARFITYNQRI